MKANVKRPARFSFKTITEKKAKHLTLIFVAVLFLVIVVLALFLRHVQQIVAVSPSRLK